MVEKWIKHSIIPSVANLVHDEMRQGIEAYFDNPRWPKTPEEIALEREAARIEWLEYFGELAALSLDKGPSHD